jgi:hypothetical protein
MRDATPADSLDGPAFPSITVIRSVVHAAAATDRPIRVVDEGRLVGVVDRRAILESIAGAEEPPPVQPEGAPVRRDAAPPVKPVNEPTQQTAEFLVENLHEGEAQG